MKEFEFLSKSKLYKIRLVSNVPTLFGDHEYSDKWDLFIKAMNDDANSERELKFKHPQHKDIEYERHYVGCPVNGIALLMLGQFRNPLDFAFVRIVLKSVNYGIPYLLIEKFGQSFRHPHIMAKMVEHAFNWVLQGTGVKLVLEPWETDEKIMWYKDYSESLMYEIIRCKGEGLTLVGYEEALGYHINKNARKRKSPIAKNDSLEDYILFKNKNLVLKLLRSQIKDARTSKKIAMPFRLLSDRKLMKRVPYKVVMSEMQELEGKISETRYNYWTNTISSGYEGDSDYKTLNKEIDNLLRVW